MSHPYGRIENIQTVLLNTARELMNPTDLSYILIRNCTYVNLQMIKQNV